MRVLLLGFDGADWDLVSSLMKKGRLSNFNKLAKKGVAAPLRSVIPPISPPAWASISTGVNPGKHGVYEFIEFDRKSFIKKVKFNPIRVKKIWNYLSEAGYRSIIINFPLMYPPEKINGITVSGLMTPSSEKCFTYPKYLTKKLKNMNYEVEISEVELFKLLFSDNEKLYDRLLQIMEKRADISVQLLTKEDWDFSMVVFGETDRIQHFFWNEPEKIKRCYMEMDKILKFFMDQVVDNDTLIIVVSDHGFREIKKYFYINSWFYLKGLLRLRNPKKIKKYREKIIKLLDSMHLKWFLRYVPQNLGIKIPSSKLSSTNLDIFKTKAYCTSGYGHIFLNENLTYQEVSKLKKELLTIIDPNNGKRVISKVFEKDELFSGDYIDIAPDLILIPDEGYFLQDKYLNDKLFDEPANAPGLARRFAEHSDLGIFFTNRKINKKGILSTYDIAPTVLSMFDIYPKNLDGYSLFTGV